jgi:DNA uptake protein ComE-like DNA-binding protein
MKLKSRISTSSSGSALVIVLWVCLGLVAIALYFAQAMKFEIRAADNRLAAVQAEQAIAGGMRYASNILSNLQMPGLLPDQSSYESERVTVGEASFWFIGRSDQQTAVDEPWFGFVDEGSKLDLNTATAAMLEALPRMTPQLAAAIVDWRDSNTTVSENGAEDETYQRLDPPYRCKNAPFESVDELRLVYGMDTEILYGDDANMNGALDPNENDGDHSAPYDDRNGVLDPGLLEYVTVWSRIPTNTRTNVNERNQLAVVLQDALGVSRANQVLQQLAVSGGGQGGQGSQTAYTNMVQFYLDSRMTRDEFDLVGDQLIAYSTNNTTGYVSGLVNVNTATEAVLQCIPGIGTDYASAIVAYRLGNATALSSIAWLVDVIGSEAARQAGPYVTTRSYQFSGDIAAVGRFGRGYKRTRAIIDTTSGAASVTYRQDLSHLGWALGRTARQDLNSIASMQ